MIDKIRAFPVIKEDKYDRLITFRDMYTNILQTLLSFNDVDDVEEILEKMQVSQRIFFHEWLAQTIKAATLLGFCQNKLKETTQSRQLKNPDTIATIVSLLIIT